MVLASNAKAALKGRIALITGASRGIGAAVARRFGREGAHVILVARTAGALEALDDEIKAAGGKATLVPMDLTEHAKIDALGAHIAERFGKLDILVGNAGVLGELTPLTHAESAMFERVISINVTANWRLLRSMHPLLNASDAGRAMFVTSGITNGVHPYWGPYATSKAALETLIRTYAAEIANGPVKVNLINPGIVRTGMRASAMPGEDPETVPPPDSITDIFVKLAHADCSAHGTVALAQPGN